MMPESVVKMSEPPTPEDVDLESRASRGYELFRQYLPELRKQYAGQLVAIDEISGEYFVAQDGKRATQRARGKYPGRTFYVAIIPKGAEPRRGVIPLGTIISQEEARARGIVPERRDPGFLHRARP